MKKAKKKSTTACKTKKRHFGENVKEYTDIRSSSVIEFKNDDELEIICIPPWEIEKLKVKIIGLVDNMSYCTGDDGKKYPIFGEGGVKKTAEEFKKVFLGEIPINPVVGKQGDIGNPIVESKPDHEISKIYLSLAQKIKNLYI